MAEIVSRSSGYESIQYDTTNMRGKYRIEVSQAPPFEVVLRVKSEKHTYLLGKKLMDSSGAITIDLETSRTKLMLNVYVNEIKVELENAKAALRNKKNSGVSRSEYLTLETKTNNLERQVNDLLNDIAFKDAKMDALSIKAKTYLSQISRLQTEIDGLRVELGAITEDAYAGNLIIKTCRCENYTDKSLTVSFEFGDDRPGVKTIPAARMIDMEVKVLSTIGLANNPLKSGTKSVLSSYNKRYVRESFEISEGKRYSMTFNTKDVVFKGKDDFKATFYLSNFTKELGSLDIPDLKVLCKLKDLYVMPNKTNNRSNKLFNTIEVSNQNLDLGISEFSVADGDRIRLYLNGTLILRSHTLESNEFILPVNLDQKVNYLMVESQRDLDKRGNTAAITVYSRSQKGTFKLISSSTQNAFLKIVYSR